MIRDEVYLTMMCNLPPLALSDTVTPVKSKSGGYEVGSRSPSRSTKTSDMIPCQHSGNTLLIAQTDGESHCIIAILMWKNTDSFDDSL